MHSLMLVYNARLFNSAKYNVFLAKFHKMHTILMLLSFVSYRNLSLSMCYHVLTYCSSTGYLFSHNCQK